MWLDRTHLRSDQKQRYLDKRVLFECLSFVLPKGPKDLREHVLLPSISGQGLRGCPFSYGSLLLQQFRFEPRHPTNLLTVVSTASRHQTIVHASRTIAIPSLKYAFRKSCCSTGFLTALATSTGHGIISTSA